MPTRANWPSVSVQVAWNPGTFTETTLAATKGACIEAESARGRQYELGRSEAGLGRLLFDDHDGYYTPGAGNAAAPAPVAGNLKLFREYRLRATWAATTYDVCRGFIERWPTRFSDGGNFGWTDVTTVDAFAILGGQTLRSAADHEVLADSPLYLYRLDEGQGSTGAGDSINPAINPVATRVDGKYGAATLAFGATTGLVDGATGVSFGTAYSGNTDVASVLAIAQNGVGPVLPASSAHSVECWFVGPATAPTVSITYLLRQSSDPATGVNRSATLTINSSGNLVYSVFDGTNTAVVNTSSVASVCDGRLHHVVATLASDGKTVKIYLDGALIATGAAAAAVDTSGYRINHVGARIAANGVVGNQFPGVIARVAAYTTELSLARVTAHYQSGKTGFSGEDSGARISRLLSYAGWAAALTDIGTGSSTMGPALTNGISALEAIQSAADDELGNLWVSGAGKVTFRGRQVRQTTTTSALTFGENTAGGEIPYLQDVQFDYDPSYVIDTAEVTRTGGAKVTAKASSTVLPYPKTLTREIGVDRDSEATDQANWLLAQYANPRQRVATLTIDPAAKPSLWPVALGTEINTRVTVKRRAINQPQFSIDCWVEAVAHKVTATGWLTTFLLSPVDSPRALLWDTDNWDDPNAVWAF